MAIQKKGILGGFSGSVASVTGYGRYEKEIIQGKSNRSNVQYKSIQLLNQSRFKHLTDFLKSYYYIFLKLSNYPDNVYTCPWNYLMQSNYPAYDSNGLQSPSLLKPSFGTLLPERIINLNMLKSTNRCYFVWTYDPNDPLTNPFDNTYSLLFNETQNEFFYIYMNTPRQTGTFNYKFPDTWLIDDICSAWLWFCTYPVLSNASPSYYIQRTIR